MCDTRKQFKVIGIDAKTGKMCSSKNWRNCEDHTLEGMQILQEMFDELFSKWEIIFRDVELN